MKFKATTTFKTEAGDVDLVTTKDVGTTPHQVNALAMFLSGIANDMQIQPGKPKRLVVDIEE